MTIPGCLVVQHPGSDVPGNPESPAGWQITVGDQTERLAANVPHAELAVCANLLAQTAGIKNIHVVIAPDSTSCFFVKLKPSDDIDIRDRAALTYELEDHLPIDAESMTADFVPIESPSGEAGMIGSLAIPLQPWHSIVEAFESSDLPVRSIVPSAVLIARGLSDGGDLAETVRWLLIDGPRCDCICVRNETILSWNHLATDETALRRQLLLDHSEADRTVIVGGDSNRTEIIRAILPAAEVDDRSADSLAGHGTRLLLENRSQRWFDLRRDGLGPSDPLRAIGKQLRWVAVAATLCFLALAIGGWWRSNRIEHEIAEIREQQIELFREAFPNARVTAVLTRVRSEHRNVANSRGQNLDVDIPPSATIILRTILEALPSDVRYKVTDLKIINGIVNLNLLVKSRKDAGIIASAIEARGFEVPSPNTRRNEDDESQYDAPIIATWIGTTSSPRGSE